MPVCDGSVLGEIAVVSCQVRKPKGMVSRFLQSQRSSSSADVAPLSDRPGGLSYEST
jgi:hypothetical protein